MQINCEAVEKCLREAVNKSNWKAFQKEYIDASGDHYMSASTLKFYGVVDKIIEKWDDIK
jgi:ATP-dependent protease ClpP protease subunit